MTVEHRGRYQRWLPVPDALLALRQSFAFDAASPVYPATVDRAPGGADGDRADFASRPLDGALPHGVPGRAAPLRCARRARRAARLRPTGRGEPGARDRPRPAASRVSSSPSGVRPPGRRRRPRTGAVLAAALAGVSAAALPAVVSEVPGAPAAVNGAIAARTAAAGLPLSPVAAASRAGPRRSPAPAAPPPDARRREPHTAPPVAPSRAGARRPRRASPTPGGTTSPAPGRRQSGARRQPAVRRRLRPKSDRCRRGRLGPPRRGDVRARRAARLLRAAARRHAARRDLLRADAHQGRGRRRRRGRPRAAASRARRVRLRGPAARRRAQLAAARPAARLLPRARPAAGARRWPATLACGRASSCRRRAGQRALTVVMPG